MEMAESDIVKEYREAMYPQEQIGILADLNSVPRKQIVDVLIRNGVDVPQMRKGRPRRVVRPDKETRKTEKAESDDEKHHAPEPQVIPDCIRQMAYMRIGQLDDQMQDLKRRELEIKTELKELEKEYAEIVEFLGV